MRVVPVTRDQARAFVREHHRHGRRPASAEVLRAGLAERSGQLVGVALAGLPARELMDGFTLEVTRVCTIGGRNACSMLYGAIARAAKALGWRRLYTYTRASEPGSSLRAAGFVEDGRVPARTRATKNGARPRYDVNLLGERVEEDGEEKIRWRRDLWAENATGPEGKPEMRPDWPRTCDDCRGAGVRGGHGDLRTCSTCKGTGLPSDPGGSDGG